MQRIRLTNLTPFQQKVSDLLPDGVPVEGLEPLLAVNGEPCLTVDSEPLEDSTLRQLISLALVDDDAPVSLSLVMQSHYVFAIPQSWVAEVAA